jgi:hypothetical protein
MSTNVDLYDGYYGHLSADPLAAVRRETYGEGLGQASWITPVSTSSWTTLTVKLSLIADAPARW